MSKRVFDVFRRDNYLNQIQLLSDENLILDSEQEKNSENTKSCLLKIFNLVIELNGTLSGEHGIGIIKKEYLNIEVDAITTDLMKKIKSQFDPGGILNPDKSF